jgi:hypothetical protein
MHTPQSKNNQKYAEEFEERRLRSSTGGLGVGDARSGGFLQVERVSDASTGRFPPGCVRQDKTVPPDPGSAPTSKTRNPPIFVVDHYA